MSVAATIDKIRDINAEAFKYIDTDILTTFQDSEPLSISIDHDATGAAKADATQTTVAVADTTSDVIRLSSHYEGEKMATPRLALSAQENVAATVFYRQTHRSGAVNETIDISVAKGATLTCIIYQDFTADTVHLQHICATLEADSTLTVITFTPKGKLVQNASHVDVNGKGAHCDISGLGLLADQSRLHNQVTMNHHVGENTSNQLFKNILRDESQAEYTGLVYVARDAQLMSSEQLNKNLVLSDKAKAYSRPQLKILADDVKCAHGATIGQLEEEELFYLKSRGLDTQTATEMMLKGFVEVVTHLIDDTEIQTLVSAELGHDPS